MSNEVWKAPELCKDTHFWSAGRGILVAYKQLTTAAAPSPGPGWAQRLRGSERCAWGAWEWMLHSRLTLAWKIPGKLDQGIRYSCAGPEAGGTPRGFAREEATVPITSKIQAQLHLGAQAMTSGFSLPLSHSLQLPCSQPTPEVQLIFASLRFACRLFPVARKMPSKA